MEIGDLVYVYSYGNLSRIGMITHKETRNGHLLYRVFWPDFKSWWYFSSAIGRIKF